MNIFLVSNLGVYRKKDGNRIAKEIENSNNIIEQLSEVLINRKKIVFIPGNSYNHLITDQIANLTFESFKISGLGFETIKIIDSRSSNIENEILTGDLLFLGGGYPLEQMTFFNTLNLSEIIKKYKGTIIAQSAGAINCANKALSIPEEISRFDDPSTWEGLGITNLNIEPHFKMEIDHTNLEEKLIREKLLNLSLNNKIIGLPDGSHIRILDELVETFGENYIIENGIIIQKEKNKVKQ